jgi:hypothetical protein
MSGVKHLISIREDLELQRLRVAMALQQMEMFVKKTDVSYCALATLVLSDLTSCYSPRF